MLCVFLTLLAQPKFVDATTDLGLILDTNAACWIDIDRDQWPDLVAGGKVWRNIKGEKFDSIADVGICVAADFDNDGYPDLFSWSRLKLYRNKKGKTFNEVPLPAEVKTNSRGACWGDWNGDGFVDLYIGGYENWETQTTFPSFILINEKGKGFRVARTESKFRTRGVTACDYNVDGNLDIYTSNYRLQPNQLWQGDGKGDFKDVAEATGTLATSPGFNGGHSIGAAWGDFDSDGNIDLFAGNFAHVDQRGDQPKSRFLKNLGKDQGFRFEDKGPSGIFYQESYATPAAADFDNDGQLDLFFTTVYPIASFGKKNNPVLFQNGGEFKFNDVTPNSGLTELPATYQAAWADFDRDGKIDLITGGKLFRNQTSTGNWLQVRLTGDGKRVNRSAIGTQVRIQIGKQTMTRQVEAGTGEGNQNDLTLHFGFGEAKERVNLDILWPDGKRQRVNRAQINRIIEVKR